MIEVVEHGDSYKMIECPRCKAVLGFSEADIGLFETRDVNQKIYFARILTCPECKLTIDLDLAKIVTEDEITT